MDICRDALYQESEALAASESYSEEAAAAALLQTMMIAGDACPPDLMAALCTRLRDALEEHADIREAMRAYEAGLAALIADGRFAVEQLLMRPQLELELGRAPYVMVPAH